MTTKINELSKDDIGMLWQIADQHKVICIRMAHEHPTDKFHANEAVKIKRICEALRITFTQKP